MERGREEEEEKERGERGNEPLKLHEMGLKSTKK